MLPRPGDQPSPAGAKPSPGGAKPSPEGDRSPCPATMPPRFCEQPPRLGEGSPCRTAKPRCEDEKPPRLGPRLACRPQNASNFSRGCLAQTRGCSAPGANPPRQGEKPSRSGERSPRLAKSLRAPARGLRVWRKAFVLRRESLPRDRVGEKGYRAGSADRELRLELRVPSDGGPHHPTHLLRLTDFKSFADETIELAPLTILLGANASGKSNALDAIRFLQGIALDFSVSDVLRGRHEGGRIVWPAIRGGIAEVCRSGCAHWSLETE